MESLLEVKEVSGVVIQLIGREMAMLRYVRGNTSKMALNGMSTYI